MIRIIFAALLLLGASPVLAQEQQEARVPAAVAAPTTFDMVAADRETAWRINRQTGEVLICRVNTTAGLDSVAATCALATMAAGGAQQSQAPGAGAPAGGPNRP